jgi:hypothetical protein
MLRRVLCPLAFCPTLALGQAPASVTIAIRVVDSANAPVAGADLSVVRDVSASLAHGTTNTAGHARLSMLRSAGDLQLAVRKIGYQRSYRFFTLPAADSMVLEIRLLRSVVSLAPVTISAKEDLRRKSYHLDADDIENSSRAMIDGTDIFKLRPDMMNSRGGAQACAVPWTPRDGWIESVWINGRRVILPIVDSVYVAGRKAALGLASRPPRPNPRISQGRGRAPAPRPMPPPFSTFSHIDTVLSILHSIKPEHIAEITYHDCFDTSIDKSHSDLAMFIALKPGIGYKDGIGSYVVADEEPKTNGTDLGALPRYRFRLLGVFDGETGDALPGVDVLDTLSGTSAKTTSTGTVSLFFVPEGTRGVRLHRDGYRDTTFTLTISPTDTIPLTFTMPRHVPPSGRRGDLLPAGQLRRRDDGVW